MTATPARVPDELFLRLSEQLSAKQMVELTAAIALENFSARFNRAFGIEPG
jgi:alkylhydroperoxidase family enzyme